MTARCLPLPAIVNDTFFIKVPSSAASVVRPRGITRWGDETPSSPITDGRADLQVMCNDNIHRPRLFPVSIDR